ncbi:MAG: SCO family protein [Candidatus Hodarchaeales archaeon]|jgi:protein SCO1/2
MGQNQLIAVLAFVVIGSVVVTGGLIFIALQPEPLPILGEAGDFKLLNEDNQTVTLGSFSNKVVVVDFIYTNCVDAEFCPLSTSKMAQLQDKLLESGFDSTQFHLVSISFDWLYDGPVKMKAYGTTYGADFSSWSFLSGNESQVLNATEKYQIVSGYIPDNVLMFHTMKFSIIDKDGNIRSEYNTNKWNSDQVFNEVSRLIAE